MKNETIEYSEYFIELMESVEYCDPATEEEPTIEELELFDAILTAIDDQALLIRVAGY